MGYTSTFAGQVKIEPPLNPSEIAYLKKFNETRRMLRGKGQYFVEGSGYHGQGHDSDIYDYNRSEPPQPGLWCQWIPTDDGSAIKWDEVEKFCDAAEWMQYLIDHFLRPMAYVSRRGQLCTPTTVKVPSRRTSLRIDGLTAQEYERYFANFTFDHTANGEIEVQGEESDDFWVLAVENNEVMTKRGRVVYE